MNHIEAGAYWNESAESWSTLVLQGFDVYRDHLNTPAFFQLLPEVTALSGLDIGCGEGYNTRLLAHRGARMTAIDISEVFIRFATAEEHSKPLGIRYEIASAVNLPFEQTTFDFATAFMSLMDIPETDAVLAEAFRVIRPGGFLQFSISHPCFNTPHRKNLKDATGKTYAIEVGEYFNTLDGRIDQWIFGTVPAERRQTVKPFTIPVFTRTLSQWITAIVQAGFIIEAMNEPRPDDETVARYPSLLDNLVVPYFLHIRCRKPQ